MTFRIPQREMPEYYQSADCKFILETLFSGEPCSIIGVGSVGKSNLLRHVIRPEVKRYHLSSLGLIDPNTLITVLLDPHSMLHLEGRALDFNGRLWPGYELMVTRLFRTVYAQEAPTRTEPPSPLVTRLRSLQERIYSGDSVVAQSALRQVESSVEEVLTFRPQAKIAFVFDEIDEFRRLPAEFFQSLRGLRDDFKGRVMYLTTSRVPLDDLMLESEPDKTTREIYEQFVELFHDHTAYISPLDEPSTRIMLANLKERYRYQYGQAHDDYLLRELFTATGGHAGLLRRCFKPAVRYATTVPTPPMALDEYLLANEGVQKECRTLLRSLSESERFLLYNMLRNAPVSPEMEPVWQKLLKKHFVIQQGGTASFRSPLLGKFISQDPEILREMMEVPR